MTRADRRHLVNGILFASPWLIGLSVFLAYPILSSLYYSFCDYSTLRPAVWVGLQNYQDLGQDAVMFKSLRNTLVFGAIALPGSLTAALMLALLLNSGVRGLPIFRTIFYLPCLVPAVASAMLWLWVLNGDFGILNYALGALLGPLGLRPPTWLADPLWAKPALAIMSIWGCGGTMVIYLAGLQDVPAELYEAAEIDGAGWWRRLFHVTLPCLSPVIYFTLIIGIIAVLQVFTPAYIMGGGPQGGTQGQPAQSTLFYALYMWAQAFEWLRMGYGCAMAWILFVIILVLTLIAHRTAGKRVTYVG
ncbi:MAG TPA: sugar ABC transporter permease [Phycisphaerae bacterium]|nr:sugar ABC transporter permease [Phycisphaerae bacterium]HRR84325.1 sugar ABC transporter permease [Phycisphaerae bacterium]